MCPNWTQLLFDSNMLHRTVGWGNTTDSLWKKAGVNQCFRSRQTTPLCWSSASCWGSQTLSRSHKKRINVHWLLKYMLFKISALKLVCWNQPRFLMMCNPGPDPSLWLLTFIVPNFTKQNLKHKGMKPTGAVGRCAHGKHQHTSLGNLSFSFVQSSKKRHSRTEQRRRAGVVNI